MNPLVASRRFLSSQPSLRNVFLRSFGASTASVVVTAQPREVQLRWDEVEGAESYQVSYKKKAAKDFNVLVSSNNEAVLRNVCDDSVYEYSITPFLGVSELQKGSCCSGVFHLKEELERHENSGCVDDTNGSVSTEVVSDISPLEIRIGKIIDVCKHPSADKLYIEKVQCGDEKGPRTVVSGLVDYCSEKDLLNRKVVVLCNLKPRMLQGVESHGMLLCASDSSHKIVEPICPPSDSNVGELVHFSGHKCLPKPSGNAAVKAFKRIADKLYVSSNGIASFDGIPFMTGSGACTSSIKNGRIS